MLFHLLKNAALIYHAFFKSTGKSETGAECAQHLIAYFTYWKGHTPEVERYAIRMYHEVSEFHLLRLKMVNETSLDD